MRIVSCAHSPVKPPSLRVSVSEHLAWPPCANHADTDVLKKKYRRSVIDVSPVEYISITINGGYNGMDDRKCYYTIARQVLV